MIKPVSLPCPTCAKALTVQPFAKALTCEHCAVPLKLRRGSRFDAAGVLQSEWLEDVTDERLPKDGHVDPPRPSDTDAGPRRPAALRPVRPPAPVRPAPPEDAPGEVAALDPAFVAAMAAERK
jgi:hypothetical protein